MGLDLGHGAQGGQQHRPLSLFLWEFPLETLTFEPGRVVHAYATSNTLEDREFEFSTGKDPISKTQRKTEKKRKSMKL
jgi:hypothetical protein